MSRRFLQVNEEFCSCFTTFNGRNFSAEPLELRQETKVENQLSKWWDQESDGWELNREDVLEPGVLRGGVATGRRAALLGTPITQK